MKKGNVLMGIAAAFGIALTSGVAYPMVNLLREFTVEELAFARGVCTATVVGLIWGKSLQKPDRFAVGYAFMFASAILCGYNGARAWGVQLTTVTFATMPVVNFIFQKLRGQRVGHDSVITAVMLVVGSGVALQIWQVANMNMTGLAWSITGTILGGLGYESSKRSTVNSMTRAVGIGTVLAVLATMSVMLHKDDAFVREGLQVTPGSLALLTMFCLLSGVGYFIVVNIAIDNLPAHVAAVIGLLEIPVIILVAWLMLDERMSAVQLIGVAVAISGPTILGWRQAQKGGLS